MKRYIRSLVGQDKINKFLAALRYARLRIDLSLIRLCSLTRFSAGLYYLFFNHGFKREQQSVLCARLAYHKEDAASLQTSALLRRNTHRLEKGLIMRPRKSIFAESYIRETVECYAQSIKIPGFSIEELKWAGDVLREYFQVVDDPSVDEPRTLFMRLDVVSKEPSILYSPYERERVAQSGINYDNLLVLFKQRRSVRWYEDKPVEINLIKQAVTAASYAPSACNRQSFYFYLVIEKDKIKAVADCAMGTVGFADNIPCLIVVVGDLSAYPEDRDRHIIYIDSALASMQLMLSFEALGLSSCPINWPDIESREARLQRLLALPDSCRPTMMISVGYALGKGGIPYSQKKNADTLIKVVE
ncbi:nitroreductase family protein [Pseudomaricurvus alcaniphilus]|uniref:nitroreductase family protein n=1 Tax=Pseudomaricurvus alcaniphilus TaxID=1166482 RepID=UPI0014095433|nr:nitroreductase family protein [Pseudomaricurvus alcaniphilus]NHN38099.1 nitroreductase family protein [Pseudomaricurvus alcaniphilus]